MATIKTDYASGSKPMPTPSGQEVISVYAELTLVAGDVANGNVLQFFKLPGGCVPVGYVISNADLDTSGSPTLTADFGILNAGGTAISTAAADGGDEWIDGSTAVQAASLTLHTASKGAYDVLNNVQESEEDRVVALVFASAAATAAGGVVGVELQYKAA